MKKKLTQTKQFIQNHSPEILIATGVAIVIVVGIKTVVDYNKQLQTMKVEADEAKRILTIIWETYLPDPELVQNATVTFNK